MFCYSNLCEKVVLKALHHLSPKVFRFLVGVSKTLVASARLKQVFQKGNRRNAYVSALKDETVAETAQVQLQNYINGCILAEFPPWFIVQLDSCSRSDYSFVVCDL